MPLDEQLRSAIAALAAQPAVLVASDFDGVLAPLVLDPMSARAVDGSLERLEELAALPGTHVAVVSGRDLETLTELTQLHDSAVTRIGSHGAQSSDGQGLADSLDRDQESTLQALTAGLEDVVDGHPGARLEHKPTATVLHTRGQEPQAAAAAVRAALEVAERHTGVKVMRGKEVVEMAVVSADKGTALMRLKDRVGADAVAYFGDDVTDEDVFGLLGDADLGVKVGAGQTRARFRLDGPQDVAAALAELVEHRRAAQS